MSELPFPREHCLPGCDRLDGHDGRDAGACMRGGAVLNVPLTRENRYRRLSLGIVSDGDDGSRIMELVLACRSCGSLVAGSQEHIHERLHPRTGCEIVHPKVDVACSEKHCWEEQFG